MGMMLARLHIPAFTKGKEQLGVSEVERFNLAVFMIASHHFFPFTFRLLAIAVFLDLAELVDFYRRSDAADSSCVTGSELFGLVYHLPNISGRMHTLKSAVDLPTHCSQKS